MKFSSTGIVPVPEPAGAWLMVAGTVLLLLGRRRLAARSGTG